MQNCRPTVANGRQKSFVCTSPFRELLGSDSEEMTSRIPLEVDYRAFHALMAPQYHSNWTETILFPPTREADSCHSTWESGASAGPEITSLVGVNLDP